MPDSAASDHKAGVKGASSDTAQRMPCSIIEPVPEAVESVRYEIFGRSEVEPGID